MDSIKPVNVSDLIFHLLVGVADKSPEILQTNLPVVLDHLITNGRQPESKTPFWNKDNFTSGVSRFAQIISTYDSPLLPNIFFNCVIATLMNKKQINLEKLVLVPPGPDDADVGSSKPYYALIVWILDSLSKEKDPKLQQTFETYIASQLKQLKKIADDNVEEDEYLISEIEEITGITLDSYYTGILGLEK